MTKPERIFLIGTCARLGTVIEAFPLESISKQINVMGDILRGGD